jgi:HSP20 family protein
MFHSIFGMPTLRSAGTFEELSRMRQQMDRLMDTFFNRSSVAVSAGVFPAINLTEDDNAFYLRAELPGLEAGDLQVQATANNVTISGERRFGPEDSSAKYHRREREAGKFSRAIALPKEIDADRVEARMSNGILVLKIAKSEAAKPRRIQISG